MRLWAFLVLLLFAGTLHAQVAGVSVDTPPFSFYGYQTLVIPGADREEYRIVYDETDTVTSWTTDGSGNMVVNEPGHGMQVGDLVWAKGFTAAGANVSNDVWYVSAVTASTYTLNNGNSSGSGTETTATMKRIYGNTFTPTGTWTITTTTPCGGASQPVCPKFHIYTQDDTQDTGYVTSPTLSGIPPFMNWGVDPSSVGGDCSHTGDIRTSNFTLSSTIAFDITFTSADDPSKSGTHHFLLCKVGGGFAGHSGILQTPLGFRTVYKNRDIPLMGQVFGHTNQMINWTIDSAPAGGDASLLYATYPQPVFRSGTVSGLYGINACPAVDSSAGACLHLSIWVSPNSPPAANTDKVEQVPCDTDSNMGITWGSIYDIKPGTATPDLLSIPQAPVGPLLIRVWNTGANGTPTEYHNQMQVNLPSGGPFTDTHPAAFMCGVPNQSTGELPIIDGADATVNSWASGYIVAPYGIIGFAQAGNNSQPYNGQRQPYSYVSIEGLHIRNITGGYNFYVPGGGDTGTWGESMAIRPYGIEHWAQIGMHIENVANPFFDDCNTHQSGWVQCTISTLYEGSTLNGYGYQTSYLSHPFYLQAEGGEYSILNNLEGAEPSSQGTGMMSDRGFRSFHMYEHVVPTGSNSLASGPGGHSDAEDAANYLADDEFWGYQGAADCNTQYSEAPGCQGITGVNDMDWFAALQEEHSKTDFVIGNTIYQPYAGNKVLGISITHGQNSFIGSLSSQWGRLSLRQWIAYNTLLFPQTEVDAHGLSFFEDVRLDATDPTMWPIPQIWARADVVNNILPFRDNTNCAYNCATFGTSGSVMMKFQTNMVEPGQVTITDPLYYSGWSGGSVYHSGISQAIGFYQYGNINPINKHLSGFTAANFPTYTTFPFDKVTFVPSTTSAAVGKATALTGELAYYPPRFNAVTANMDPFVIRTDTTTLGAMDPSTVGPTLTSIAVTPAGPVNLTYPATQQLTATCTYSDSSTADCTTTVTWSNGGNASFSVTGGLISSNNVAGSGTAIASSGAVNSNSVTVNVSVPPQPTVYLGPGAIVKGSVAIE